MFDLHLANDPSDTTYTSSVTNATTSLTVTPAVSDSTATVKVNGTTVASGTASGSITLAVGPNTITTVARWSHLQASAKQAAIGKTVDDAMVAIERDNPRLKGVLPKDYARPGLDKHRLGELIDLIATITLIAASEGEKTHRSVDLLGRVYEYFLTRFASAEGKNGGQFYTPSCVVRCLVEMLAPYKGRIYDPCCGSGGMFVQSGKFVEAHGGRLGDISIYPRRIRYKNLQTKFLGKADRIAIFALEEYFHGNNFKLLSPAQREWQPLEDPVETFQYLEESYGKVAMHR